MIELHKKYWYFVGIDTGVKTGLAFWVPEVKHLGIYTYPIHVAMDTVQTMQRHIVKILVEDSRQAVFGRQLQQHRLKGAGSVMRDAKIWEDFLTDLKVPFEMVRPRKQLTKLNADTFRKITGYTGKTSEHGRDAAMLVFGLQNPNQWQKLT
jgi:hypothetical protein